MTLKRAICLSAALCCLSQFAQAQKLDSYLSDMREALVPFGTMTALNCHRVEIDLTGPWADFAIPAGADPESPGHLKWAILRVDVLRVYVDLADVDEDKSMNQAIFSLEYIQKHQQGSQYVPDTPAVFLATRGLNTNMIVHAIDLDRVHALKGRKDVKESDMGLYMDQRRMVILTFSDQQHADVFYRAVQKAAVICKAQ